ncbi:MAG TPA: hypothetical protein VJ802_09915 [Gemmatimonadaceae bacterium]|nr:hypothetical protein [Gemmatimonadaceae bacterium]
MSQSDVLLVRSGSGGWTAREPWARLGPFALVGWWPPIVIPRLVPSKHSADQGGAHASWSADFSVAVSRGRRRLRRVSLIVGLLRALGVLLLLWIAVAIPLATGRFGVYGLVRGVVQAFAISVLMMLLALPGLRWLGMTRRASLRATLPLLSPFTAPRACETVLAAALRDLPPHAQVAALFGEARFLQWIRPSAYDALHGHRVDGEVNAVTSLVAALPRPVLERALAGPPDDERGVRYCPRCARTYREEIATCYECEALSLVARS